MSAAILLIPEVRRDADKYHGKAVRILARHVSMVSYDKISVSYEYGIGYLSDTGDVAAWARFTLQAIPFWPRLKGGS
jgi:hypothetical protein